MRLMISVVSAAEAREAMSSGAVLLDVKNPEEGSLGAQFPKVVREIKETASGNIELSVAIGDMPNLPGTAALAALGAAVCKANYIKVGLWGSRSEAEAIAMMCAVQEAVGAFSVAVIAAGYADYQRIGSIDPRCLPLVAASAGIRGCLIDTAVKDGATILDFMNVAELTALTHEAHAKGLLFGAAGALCEQDLEPLRNAGVDVVGLRTAVCRNNQRNGPLDPSRVRDLIQKFGEDTFKVQ
jgi:(5-formylfuran-3-yl)methyl phosphate synthase